ncbi:MULTISPECIES: MerR family transcriptional regulator [Sorangium]|uniref:MerR family transcriptional regulator n=1 Tax=Sorangium cellulosum TaxID=56 RepID=A0A4P2R2T2_SORCE|nr:MULTISPECIES: MerR family transcriptional regulator [Sorangium]AUX37327.1 MerR family transcriptional regulator [Sorangium cellulosum]WCQ96616.1 Nodulation protein NolA [Sorangium sp. Soce836]
MRSAPLKVGDLAKQTGLSVRTLHYYEEIGLLSPSHRTASGHRMYSAGDVARLQQIKSLRELGFSLEQITGCLDRPGFSPLETIELHLARLREQIALEQKLCARLEGLANVLRAGEDVSVEQLLQTIEVMTMIEKYYTPEQLAELKQRAEAIGPEKMREAESAWKQIYEDMRAEMQKGADPKSEPVQQIVKRMRELIDAFTGKNPGIERSLNRMYQEEPSMRNQHGVDPALHEFIGKAMS